MRHTTMTLQCAHLPNYDTRSCCQECHDNKHTDVWRVRVRGNYIRVCENAFRYARKHGMSVSKGDISPSGVPISEREVSIRLNHK